MKYDEKKIKEILEAHALWIRCDPKGIRANLSRANLSGANLFGATLSRANRDEFTR